MKQSLALLFLAIPAAVVVEVRALTPMPDARTLYCDWLFEQQVRTDAEAYVEGRTGGPAQPLDVMWQELVLLDERTGKPVNGCPARIRP